VGAARPEVVVILTGPFVDMVHPLLSELEDVVLDFTEEEGVPTDVAFRRHVAYEMRFAARVAADLKEL